MNEVKRYTLDILSTADDEITADSIAEALETLGITVNKIEWQATWNESDYESGEQPKAHA